jgi:hypothetical protein
MSGPKATAIKRLLEEVAPRPAALGASRHERICDSSEVLPEVDLDLGFSPGRLAPKLTSGPLDG